MSRRSHWGWGSADRFLDREARASIGAAASEHLGFVPPRLLDPVPLDQADIPPPRIRPPQPIDLFVRTDRETLALHTYGRGYRDLVRGFRGDFSSAPDLVAFPEAEADIAQVLAFAADERFAVTPFGGGTSVVGGVEGPPRSQFRGLISLDLSRLDRVQRVDPVSRSALIEAGATGPRLEAQLARHDLTLRHYPQSFEFSTLGGWIATRAAGHYATHRTRIDDFVEAVRMITPSGLFQSRRLPSSGAGPSPERFVLGSEGVFGVITEAWVRVSERPRYRARAVISFNGCLEAAEAARGIVQAGLLPANVRVLDPLEAKLNGVRLDGRAVMLLAFESADHSQLPALDRALDLARARGGTVDKPPRVEEPQSSSEAERTDAERWKQAFFDGPYLQNVMVSLGIVADTFETACTWDRFPEVYAGIRAEVGRAMEEVAGSGAISCRLTHVYPDGPAPYFTFLFPAKEGGELSAWAEIKAAASEAILRLGATITHHHAVGRLHRPWYDRERPEVFAEGLRAAKRALDPQGILNPGVLIDPL
ncbi:MAG: FAD-binding oxidoreductase [Myxococcota bacterium]